MRTFVCLQNSNRSAAYNLAIEEAIGLHLVSSGYGAGLRIWRNPFSIVLGLSEKAEDTVLPEVLQKFQVQTQNPFLKRNDYATQKSAKEFSETLSEQNRNSIENDSKNDRKFLTKESDSFLKNGSILGYGKRFDKEFPAIVRRASGGGTVVHHPEENLNFTFFVSLDVKPELYKVKESYGYFLNLVITALKRQTLSASCRGKSDLAVWERGLEKKFPETLSFEKKRGRTPRHLDSKTFSHRKGFRTPQTSSRGARIQKESKTFRFCDVSSERFFSPKIWSGPFSCICRIFGPFQNGFRKRSPIYESGLQGSETTFGK